MDRYLVTVTWTEQHVEQVRVGAASAPEACPRRVWRFAVRRGRFAPLARHRECEPSGRGSASPWGW